MPSGSEEPQRDPAPAVSLAGGLRLRLVLGGGCFPASKLLGLNMAVTVRTETVKQMCQLQTGASAQALRHCRTRVLETDAATASAY